MTGDGSDDHKIKPEGILGYKVIPPLPNPGPNEIPEAETPEPTGKVNC